MTAVLTPVQDLLGSIPADARLIYEHSPTDSQSIPIGKLAQRARALILHLLRRQDELLETTNRYLGRARQAEYALAHSDRLVGELTRVNERLNDAAIARDGWLHRAKLEAGYSPMVSFDVVWAETRAKADRFTSVELAHLLALVKGGTGGTKPGGGFTAEGALALKAKLAGMVDGPR